MGSLDWTTGMDYWTGLILIVNSRKLPGFLLTNVMQVQRLHVYFYSTACVHQWQSVGLPVAPTVASRRCHRLSLLQSTLECCTSHLSLSASTSPWKNTSSYTCPVSTASHGLHMGQTPCCGCSCLVSMIVRWTMRIQLSLLGPFLLPYM